jgi:protein-disulfide isomerase
MTFDPVHPVRRLALVIFALIASAASAGAQDGAAPAPASASVADDSLHIRADMGRYRGAEDAPITIFEFSDFQCPFCREFERKTAAAVDSAFVRTGSARVIYFNLPLPSHAHSWVAAEAAMCASAQGKFWPMHDLLFAQQDAWSAAPEPGALFERYAAQAGVEMQAYRACTANDRVAGIITQDLTYAVGHGVGSTPTFVLLREPVAGEDPQNSQRILSGAVPFADFQKAMDELKK